MPALYGREYQSPRPLPLCCQYPSVCPPVVALGAMALAGCGSVFVLSALGGDAVLLGIGAPRDHRPE